MPIVPKPTGEVPAATVEVAADVVGAAVVAGAVVGATVVGAAVGTGAVVGTCVVGACDGVVVEGRVVAAVGCDDEADVVLAPAEEDDAARAEDGVTVVVEVLSPAEVTADVTTAEAAVVGAAESSEPPHAARTRAAMAATSSAMRRGIARVSRLGAPR